MKNNYSFREPLNEEPDGTYITVGQMQFFLNRKNGKRMFKSGSVDFIDYYNMCRVYNLISEIMESNEDAAIMYWDSKKEIVSVGFPATGLVATALSYMDTIEDSDMDF
jgi:hypothetical protein